MDVVEIITDAIRYPIENVQGLVIYIVLSIIIGIILLLTGATTISVGETNLGAGLGIALIGIIISLILAFAIEGYSLDIIKLGIQRSNSYPDVDLHRQAINGIKLIITNIVYFIIPVIIWAIISLIFQHWISIIVGIILFIIFALAATMAQCRLAQTDSLDSALAVSEAISDITRVGFANVILTIIAIAAVTLIIGLIVSFISYIYNPLGTIIGSILSIYILFFSNRAIGLLYSNA